MATLSTTEILREALRDRHGREDFERTLGRTLRRLGLTYADYIRTISVLRERATSRGVTLVVAARELAGMEDGVPSGKP